MNDIAYVLAKNTPLRVLNLSDNVVDAKAALVLSRALGSNSNLRELDLRNNRLKNAGVALLMEIFIMQQLQKLPQIEEKKSKAKADRRGAKRAGKRSKANEAAPSTT
jgi:Ran GTPase-activating protein (RanGAP) involved in mRNA processing and transport